MHDDTLAAWLAEEGYDSDGWGAAAMIRQADGSVVSAACGHARPGISFTTDTVSYTGSLAKADGWRLRSRPRDGLPAEHRNVCAAVDSGASALG